MTITVIGDNVANLEAAVAIAGGNLVELGDSTRGLIWFGTGGPTALAEAVRQAPQLEWVQLPAAGIEGFVSAGVLRSNILWTAAQGAYSVAVAEHAIALMFAGLRQLSTRARARYWQTQSGVSLCGKRVVIVGGGGIAEEIARMLAPFSVDIVCVRRTADLLVPGADRTVTSDELLKELPYADVVIVALALTPDSQGIFGGEAFAAMKDDAVFVNIARGAHVDTEALVAALNDQKFYGVCLDVTDPEPLPDEHPLWAIDRVLITPHTANTPDMLSPRYAARVQENVCRFLAGEQLVGTVDVGRGY